MTTRDRPQERYDGYLVQNPNPTAEQFEKDLTMDAEIIINEIKYKNEDQKRSKVAPTRWHNKDDYVKRNNKAYEKIKAAHLANITITNHTTAYVKAGTRHQTCGERKRQEQLHVMHQPQNTPGRNCQNGEHYHQKDNKGPKASWSLTKAKGTH